MEHVQVHDESIASFPAVAAKAETKSFTVFNTWCAGVVATGGMLLMAFVVLVDPYRLFGFVDKVGFNNIKPLPEQYREEIKVAQAISARPSVLLLGNSRIEVGLDGDANPLRTHGLPTYNLGLAGSGLTISQRAFEQVRGKYAPPAMTVIGVEFLDFLISPSDKPSSSPPAHLQSLQWRADTVFSLKAVADTLRTLTIQTNSEVETLTSHGHTPLLEYRKYARQEGYNAIFKQRAQENAKNVVRKPHNLFSAATGSSESINRLRDLLGTMAQDGTEVHLVIYPYHAQLMAMFEEAGLQPTMEQWKRMLVREIETVKSRKPEARITLWDFSGFAFVQCERIPAPGDKRSVTKWYWEGGHFKSTTGDLILRRILGDESPIGVNLTARNLDENRQRIVGERARCLNDYPEVFAEARSMIGNARSQRH